MSDSTTRVYRRHVLRVAGAIGGVSIFGTQSAGARQRDPLDRHIVGVEPGRADVARGAAAEVYRVFDYGDIGQAVSGWYPEEALEALRNNPNVRYIEAEGVMEAIGHTTDGDTGDPTQEQVLPWGIDRVDAEAAHHNDQTGAGSSIAIIDTGIDPTHETLSVTGGKAFVTCASGCAEPWDDDHGHGTHCAGIADAADNDIGVVGTSTAADLFAVKVLDGDGGGTYSDIAAGIEWTADQGIDVGSLSLGGGDSQTVEDACVYAYGKGTLLVAAAGNDGGHPVFSTVNYPAAYEEVIAVSATDENDDIASFSSRGPEVELAAPGVDILSSLPGDEYDRWNGTSMACPHVSGAGAQLMANGHSNTEARGRLNDTAEDISLSSSQQGNGLVDVAAALGLDSSDDLDGGGNSAPSVDSLSLTEVETDNSDAEFDADWQVSDADGNLASVDLTLTDDTDNETEDTATVSVSGDTASGTTRLVAAGDDGSGNSYTVELTVTDSDGATASDTASATESEDTSGDNPPTIDTYDVTEAGSPNPHLEITVDWGVGDTDGDLRLVRITAEDADGSAFSETHEHSVSGSSASGTDEFKFRHADGETADVTIYVEDAAGNTTSHTEQVTE